MYNTKNYTEQGGEKTVIGGEIVIKGKITVAEGGRVEGILATEGAAGLVRKAANVAAIEDGGTVTAEQLAGKFNELLTALIGADIMADKK
ncbi:MAG: Head fiber protein [Syntrophomonadaceae bacterium]